MNPSYRIGWSFFRIAFATYFRWRIYNPERVPKIGPVLLAANHASFLDPPLVGASLPREINYLARDSLFRFPIVGAVLRSWNAVPVDREGGGPAGLKNIFDRLRRGGGVILFPEGTRTPDGQFQRARAGIGLVAVKSKAPVIPIRLFGTYDAYGRHLKFPRPRRVVIKFGKPVDLSRYYQEAETASKIRVKEIYREVSDEILLGIETLQACKDLSAFP